MAVKCERCGVKLREPTEQVITASLAGISNRPEPRILCPPCAAYQSDAACNPSWEVIRDAVRRYGPSVPERVGREARTGGKDSGEESESA